MHELEGDRIESARRRAGARRASPSGPGGATRLAVRFPSRRRWPVGRDRDRRRVHLARRSRGPRSTFLARRPSRRYTGAREPRPAVTSARRSSMRAPRGRPCGPPRDRIRLVAIEVAERRDPHGDDSSRRTRICVAVHRGVPFRERRGETRIDAAATCRAGARTRIPVLRTGSPADATTRTRDRRDAVGAELRDEPIGGLPIPGERARARVGVERPQHRLCRRRSAGSPPSGLPPRTDPDAAGRRPPPGRARPSPARRAEDPLPERDHACSRAGPRHVRPKRDGAPACCARSRRR